jgi:hypothetical protein
MEHFELTRQKIVRERNARYRRAGIIAIAALGGACFGVLWKWIVGIASGSDHDPWDSLVAAWAIGSVAAFLAKTLTDPPDLHRSDQGR